MCTFEKAITNVEVKVDVQKGALGFRDNIDNRCTSFHPIHVFIHCCHMVIVFNDYLVHSFWGLHLSSRFS